MGKKLFRSGTINAIFIYDKSCPVLPWQTGKCYDNRQPEFIIQEAV